MYRAYQRFLVAPKCGRGHPKVMKNKPGIKRVGRKDMERPLSFKSLDLYHLSVVIPTLINAFPSFSWPCCHTGGDDQSQHCATNDDDPSSSLIMTTPSPAHPATVALGGTDGKGTRLCNGCLALMISVPASMSTARGTDELFGWQTGASTSKKCSKYLSHWIPPNMWRGSALPG